MSCSRTQHSDAGEAQTRNPLVSSQALYPRGTALLDFVDRLVFIQRWPFTQVQLFDENTFMINSDRLTASVNIGHLNLLVDCLINLVVKQFIGFSTILLGGFI